MNNISYNNLKLSSLLKYDFKLQKVVMSNLSRNLLLSKENRWLWKSSLLSDKILVNLRLGSSFVVREIYPSEFLLLREKAGQFRCFHQRKFLKLKMGTGLKWVKYDKNEIWPKRNCQKSFLRCAQAWFLV